MTFFLVLFVCEGLAMMAGAVPFIRRRVKPNPWAGFRVPATLHDDETWYRVNERLGRAFFVAGGGFALAAVGLWFVPGVGGTIVAYNLACLAVLLAALTTAVVLAARAIKETDK